MAAGSNAMFFKPPLNVGRDSGVETFAFTAKDVNVVHGLFLILHLYFYGQPGTMFKQIGIRLCLKGKQNRSQFFPGSHRNYLRIYLGIMLHITFRGTECKTTLEAFHMLQYRKSVIDKIGDSQFFTDINLSVISKAEINIFSRDADLFPKLRSSKAQEEKSSGNNIRSRYNIDSIEAAGLDDNFQTFKSTGNYPPKRI